MFRCRHCGSRGLTFQRLAAKYGEKRSASSAASSLRRTRRLPLRTRTVQAIAITAPTGNVGLGYDYQNGGSYFDGSHNASPVRGAPAPFVCSAAMRI